MKRILPAGVENLDLEVLNGKLSLRNTTAHFRIDPIAKVHLFSLLISLQKIPHQTINSNESKGK